MSLQECGQDIIETIQEDALQARTSPEERFVEFVFDTLGDIEQSDEPKPAFFKRGDNLKVNGFDLRDDGTTLDLFVADYSAYEPCRDLTNSDVQRSLKLVRRFYTESRAKLADAMPPGLEATDLARTIRDSREIQVVRLVLVTNARVAKFKSITEVVDGVTLVTSVWDLERLRQAIGGENIDVDFKDAQGRSGLPCVKLPEENGVYESYLAIVPGAFLCELYEEYGQRVLEANVRAYLQARGKVNKGIIETIREKPSMFFAYNNGITATAEDLIVEPREGGGLVLSRCRNLQVVNGGQTTASLHYARSRKVSLDKIFVPMKISVILNPEHDNDVVQMISRFANSQNKVSLSDLGSNSQFHIELERLSRRITAPSMNGSVRGWFYERARGAYQNELARQPTGKDKKKFRETHPPAQRIPKTTLAKYVMTWEQMPHVVSLGGEKNFGRMSEWLDKNGPQVPDEDWFRNLIAKAILFQSCDRLVKESGIQGYKANIVTYSLALLATLHGEKVDMEKIWKSQGIPEDVGTWLKNTIPVVRAHLVQPPREGMNITEWCKKEDCWTTLLASEPDLPWPGG